MKADRPSMPAEMLVPLLVMFLGFTLFQLWVLCTRLRAEILDRERNARWLQEQIREGA